MVKTTVLGLFALVFAAGCVGNGPSGPPRSVRVAPSPNYAPLPKPENGTLRCFHFEDGPECIDSKGKEAPPPPRSH